MASGNGLPRTEGRKRMGGHLERVSHCLVGVFRRGPMPQQLWMYHFRAVAVAGFEPFRVPPVQAAPTPTRQFVVEHITHHAMGKTQQLLTRGPFFLQKTLLQKDIDGFAEGLAAGFAEGSAVAFAVGFAEGSADLDLVVQQVFEGLFAERTAEHGSHLEQAAVRSGDVAEAMGDGLLNGGR